MTERLDSQSPADKPHASDTPRTDANLRGWGAFAIPTPFVEFARQLERELSTAQSAVVASDLRWLTPDEVTEPGNYIREDSEELCVVEMAKQRVHPPVAESYTQDALACQGSFYRPDWGDAKFYGPVSLQALLKDRQSIAAMTGLLAKARRERDEARTPRSASVAIAQDARRYNWLKDAAGRTWDALLSAQMIGRLDEAIDSEMKAENATKRSSDSRADKK